MTLPKSLSLLLVAAALAACTATPEGYRGFEPVDPAGWAYGDTVWFGLEGLCADSTAPLELTLAVIHGDTYRYSNLWLEVSYPTPPMNAVARDTLQLTLADSYGRWLGRGVGGAWQQEAPLHFRAQPAPGARVGVRHIMRVDTLRGLQHLGIAIRKP